LLHLLRTEIAAPTTFPMDMFSADQLDTPRWKLAKLAAFVCFALACCLLGASLVFSQPSVGAQTPLASAVTQH
jgi:hypothetical protein